MTGIVIGIICLTAVLCVVAITMLKIEDKLVSISEQIYRLGKADVSKINDADASRMPREVFVRYREELDESEQDKVITGYYSDRIRNQENEHIKNG